MAEHNTLTGSQLHEPKGVESAAAGLVYVSDSGTSGTWAESSAITTGAALAGQTYVADGAGSGAWESVHGWGNYKDNATAQTFTTTAAKLSIDGLGSTTETGYLPSGVSNFWNTTADTMTPDTLGDSYLIRLDLPITAVTGSASYLEMEMDIGGAATPTVVIVDRQISVSAGSNKVVSVSFGVFSLSTFLANGAQIFLKTDANTVQVTAPGILIQRVSKG